MIFPMMPRINPSPLPPPLPPSRPYLHTTHNTQNVEVHQQPVDAADAARLYGQLEDKAEARVIEIVGKQIDDIKVEFVEMQTSMDISNFKEAFKVIFKVNGKVFCETVTLDDIDRLGSPDTAVMRKIAEGITGQFMTALLHKTLLTRYHRRFG